MTLTIQLRPEDEARLAEKAESAGVDVPTYVERVLHVEASRPALEEIPKSTRRDQPRSIGWASDLLPALPDSFFEPLPEDMLDIFDGKTA